jgi:hypothetical protein
MENCKCKCELKEEATDRTLWRTCFARASGPIVTDRQTAERMAWIWHPLVTAHDTRAPCQCISLFKRYYGRPFWYPTKPRQILIPYRGYRQRRWDVMPCGLVTRTKTAWSWRQGHYNPPQYPRRQASLSASCILRKEPLRTSEREGDGALSLLLPPRLSYYDSMTFPLFRYTWKWTRKVLFILLHTSFFQTNVRSLHIEPVKLEMRTKTRVGPNILWAYSIHHCYHTVSTIATIQYPPLLPYSIHHCYHTVSTIATIQ